MAARTLNPAERMDWLRLIRSENIGPITFYQLLQRYGSLDAALADGRFAAEAEALRLYRRIATMDAGAPLPALADQTPRWDAAAALASDWGLGQLAARLVALGRGA